MSTTPSTTPPNLDVFGIMSTTAGGIGVALALWGQLEVAERYTRHVDNGHPVFDGLMLIAPAPGFLCALLALGLGTAGILTHRGARAWSIVGVVVGIIAVVFTASGLPIGLVPDPLRPQGL